MVETIKSQRPAEKLQRELGETKAAAILLNRQFNTLLQGAPDSTENYSLGRSGGNRKKKTCCSICAGPSCVCSWPALLSSLRLPPSMRSPASYPTRLDTGCSLRALSGQADGDVIQLQGV
jgi:hypothetical protein